MAVSPSVLVMQAQHAIELVRQLELDIAAVPRGRATVHLEIAEHLTLAAAVLLERAVGHLRCAVHETPVAPCVLHGTGTRKCVEILARGEVQR
jgi:hypothetical protein